MNEAFNPDLVIILRKEQYYCSERKAPVEFDVVIELYKEGGKEPHLRVIFECKNQNRPIAERDITDFSDKLSRIFKHSAKGVIVSSSRLQSGAESIAKSRGLGIAKFVEHGLETIVERKGTNCLEQDFLSAQMFSSEKAIKSLKFSAFYDGRFFSSTSHFLANLDAPENQKLEHNKPKAFLSIPFLPPKIIREESEKLLKKVGYHGGAVDLAKVCRELAISLTYSEDTIFDDNGFGVLGHANFDSRSIQIFSHKNKQRERFTIAHEIGHFYLNHDQYLRSESVVASDFFTERDDAEVFNYQRLEHQANVFAAELLLPDDYFLSKVREYRATLDINDRGHGYIFVDDQPCNYGPYNQLISCLQFDFDVSAQAIELKLEKRALLTDRRVRLTKPKP